MRNLLLAVFVLACAFSAIAQNKHPFTFEDMMALKRVEEPVPSPDGKWVLFAAVDVDLKANTKTPHIWVVSLSGNQDNDTHVSQNQGNVGHPVVDQSSGEREIISDQDADRPRWARDGKRFAFVSTKENGSQIWIADFDSSTGTVTTKHRLTNIATEADGELWSPDGKNILFKADVYPECDGTPAEGAACNEQKLKQSRESKVSAQIFTHLLFRHWNAYREGKRTHLFVIPIDSCGTSHVGADASSARVLAATKNVTADNKAADETPLYSPDGNYIAYRAQARPGYESDRFRLMLYDRKTGHKEELSEGTDRWVGAFTWAPDSLHVYFSYEDRGSAPIAVTKFRHWGNDPESRWLISTTDKVQGFNDDLVVTPDGRTLLFTRMSLEHPNEMYKVALPLIPLKQDEKPYRAEEPILAADPLTHFNDSVLSQVAMSPLESFWFTGAKGDRVEGFLVKPPNFDPGKKYPVKFLIHGGPQGAWGDDWSYRWNPELFAANGYVVVMINFHGSTGYGQKFIDAINGDWGGAPFEDLMKGLDYVEEHYGFIDKDRECALGASYGGYMTNWILRPTHRFKCIVTHDGTFNNESDWGTTEELWFNEWEFRGTPYTNRELYRKWSPHLFATNFKTPTLVIHGQLDYRLDVSEGFQLFTTLQRLGVPSKMLYFPDEGHWVLKPQNSQLWYKTVNDWVDQWVGK